MVDISIVFPVHDEKGNLQDLYEETRAVLEENYLDWEFVFVDDGSSDGSYQILRGLAHVDPDITVVKFRTNFGQSAALDAGLKLATGNVIVTMDADGQNDPRDIPALVEKLNEGYDCVCGWRKERRDPFGKRLFSTVARGLRLVLLDTSLHDFGCTLKAFNRDAAAELDIMGEMHRYIPPLLSWRGYRVGEVAVNHRPRENGTTSYGWERIPKGFIDMVNVWFWRKYSGRPLHIFGGLGILAGLVGLAGGLYSIFLKLVHAVSLSDTVLPLFAVFMCLLGIQFFISGILADISVKNYFTVKETDAYRISEVLNANDSWDARDGDGTTRVDSVFHR